MSTWKVILATLVIFAAGFMTGTFLSPKLGWVESEPKDNMPFKPWEVREEFVNRLVRDLDLRPEQKDKILQAVKESQHRIEILFELVGPEMREEMDQVRASIRDVLSPEQQAEFDELRKRRGPHKRGSSRHRHERRQPSPPGSEPGSLPPPDC